MPDVNFYLKKADPTTGHSLVYLQMRYHGKKFVYSCRFNIAPKNWDSKRQLVKSRTQTNEDGMINLNSRLKDLKEVCIKAYNTESAKGTPTNSLLKRHLDAYINQNSTKEQAVKDGPTLFGLIDQFISGEIGGKKTPGTIRTYGTAKANLLGFQKETGYPVDFDTINLEFKYKYVKYLGKEKYRLQMRGSSAEPIKVRFDGLSQNSIVKEIKNVKTFMNMAVELEYTNNLAFKKKAFSEQGETTEAIYLTEKELRKLYKFDFSDNKRLEAVRDLFVFSSFVGLRYSDASRIKPENIVKIDGDDYIKLIPEKTKKSGSIVIAPCKDIVLDIFKKYAHNRNRLPETYSNQKYNDYLKEVGKAAGLTQTGRKASDPETPLYALLSSHTARRSFATNCYLEGMDTRMIMAVTGHTTEKSFEKYIKVTNEQHAKRMHQHNKRIERGEYLRAV